MKDDNEYEYWKADARVGLMLYGYQPQEGYFVPYFFKIKAALARSEESLKLKLYGRLYDVYSRFIEQARDNYEDPSYIYLQEVVSHELTPEEIAAKIWLPAKIARWEDANCFLLDENGFSAVPPDSF